MNAAVVHSFEHGPRYGAFELPPGRGVPVQVLASALSPRARSGASGAHYASRTTLPLVPGIDGVGRTLDGQRVYFVADDVGTMAERSLVGLSVPLPEHVSSAVIAAGMLPAISSWVALTLRAPLQAGQRVLVLGATGAAGRLAVQIAKHLGASDVIAAGRDPAALDATRAIGPTQIVQLTGTPSDGGAVATVASEVDIVLDYLWGTVTSTVMPAICRHRADDSRALRWVLIGSMAGDEIALSSVLLRKRNLQILGSGQGSTGTADMFGVAPAIATAFADGILHTNVREVPLAEVADWWSIPSSERIVFIP